MAIQKPTVGRVVWYRPNGFDLSVRNLPAHAGEIAQPMMAQVVYVWNDRSVNLIVTDHTGIQWPRSSVLLMQGDETYTPRGAYAEWMPYQKGQAAKAESLEQQIKDSVFDSAASSALKGMNSLAQNALPPITGSGISE